MEASLGTCSESCLTGDAVETVESPLFLLLRLRMELEEKEAWTSSEKPGLDSPDSELSLDFCKWAELSRSTTAAEYEERLGDSW